MTYSELAKCIEFLKDRADRDKRHPGEILMRNNNFVNSLEKEYGISYKDANFALFLLTINGYINPSEIFISLTDKGYAMLYEDAPAVFKLSLYEYVYSPKFTAEKIFYLMWDVVGADPKNNPFYVDGPLFYNTIKDFINGIPPQYGQYIEDIKNHNKSTLRINWCKDLFLSLPENKIPDFLIMLSVEINRKIEANAMEQEKVAEQNLSDNSPVAAIQPKPAMEPKKKQPKIFISHNSKDGDYAAALVNMLSALGIDEENDIFCSSVPGCGVEFGTSFLDAIREQYEKYELIMIFIHSPRYYQSHISLCEMGAAWIMKSEHRSFLTADCEFDMLDAVIPPTITAFKAGQESTYPLLFDFKEFIEAKFGLKPKGPKRWESIKDAFINTVSTKS